VGLPPVKNEAKSLLSAGHGHADRVVALLEAARAATRSGGWVPTVGQPLGLELVVFAPVEPPSDATNDLGGVGDVLEAKSRRGPLTHLGDLASVWLYDNDWRIHEVLYRWQVDAETRYKVRLWTRDRLG
jgi:hypothetical protein